MDFVAKDIRTVDPWKVIVASAEGMCIPIKEPKKSCKHCHGRGWIGRKTDTGEPIACPCIFVKEKYSSEREMDFEMKPMNRAERRKKKHK